MFKRIICIIIGLVFCIGIITAPAEESQKKEKAEIITEDLILKNGDLDIFGVMMRPDTEQEIYPVVILSHGFGGNYRGLQSIGQFFAREGYAAYVFDFIGGSSTSQSGKADGDMTGMSVLTEASDLSSVIDQVKGLPYIDPEHLFLLGQSQGGYVSAYTAAQRPEDVRAMVLMFPAFALQDDCWERHGSIDNIPETEDFMNNTLGAVFSRDAMSMDIYEEIGKYTGDVLICHGDSDELVDLTYSERAAEVYENAELHVYEGAGHGFGGAQLKQFEEEALAFLNDHIQ